MQGEWLVTRDAAVALMLGLTAANSFAQTPVAGPAGLTDSLSGLRIGDPFRVPPSDPRWLMADWPDPHLCTHVSRGSLPVGVRMMVNEGRISRFEIHSSIAEIPARAPVAPFGLRTGMPMFEALLRIPSGALIEDHKYNWPGGYYVTWYDFLRNRAIRVEIADGRFVDTIYWGDDTVRLAEGCV